MATFTESALLAFILHHNCVPPKLAPVMVAVASWESGLDTSKVHTNTNGTEDVGLGQINSTNFEWLSAALRRPVNKQTLLEDPCLNLAAGARVLLVRYNGNPPDVGKVIYANGVLSRIAETQHPLPATATEVPAGDNPVAVCAAPPWDTWGQLECRANNDTAATTPTDDNKKGDRK